MSNLLSSLLVSTGAMRVFERALEVSQNNVVNASTPGYARQRLILEALPSQADAGVPGGVTEGPVRNARARYAETAVWRQLGNLGYYQQKAARLAEVETVFDITGQRGIDAALSRLYQSFSSWSADPNSATARQTVLARAREVAGSFRAASQDLARISADTDRQIVETINRINELAGRLREYNLELRRGAGQGAGLEAKMNAVLEELSEMAEFTALPAADGSITVLLGGQTPLVIGDRQYQVRAVFETPQDPPPSFEGAPSLARICDAGGRDITAQVRLGQLGGLLDTRNTLLPSLRGDAYQQGDLNILAQKTAERVNAILESGYITDGPPPAPGVPLFRFSSVSGTAAAGTIEVDGSVTGDQLAAIDPGPPYTGNGIPLRLAALANSQDPADRIGGLSFVEFYGDMAARVGRELSTAADHRELGTDLAAQARDLRSQVQGVSLDEEAVVMIQFQRAYQAAARMVTVLDEMTETAVNLLR